MHLNYPGLDTTREHFAAAGFEVHEKWIADDELADVSWPVLCCCLRG